MIKSIRGVEEYEIIELIAEGGMGAVFKAKKKGASGFEKIVAIKMLLEKLSKDRSFVAGFIAEAKLVANLIHENIVQIYQLDSCKEGYYFVSEFVDGVSLFDLMEFHRQFKLRMPCDLAVFIAARIARGLAYAHSRRDPKGHPLGIVHCDVCPHNILINSEGVPKLTDFGIARVATRAFDGKVSGKLPYIAPEQAARRPVDFHADIYSLGIVLFYLISGEMARDNRTDQDEMLTLIRSNQLHFERLSPEVPEEVRGILKKMLATNPSDRFATTADLARELEYFIYKDGYGPTIVTLADYLRKLLPGRFAIPDAEKTEDFDQTIVIDHDDD